MLSTTANPTDGLDSTAMLTASLAGLFILKVQRGKSAAERSWQWRLYKHLVFVKLTRSMTCC
ncbi:hypothetical protein HNR60_001020 [Rhodopseudomonas rhenobacensis]|uniref:Uncharacterized protein n=1 Tax=Rhodopseudomonas rhenobacensis TaxID=87461 RepID=A0A7W7Z1V9_9BRAD|nr:hypothetical protein [Rhodopseudomonas rhenobacensis]MBB5046275.1 hypothetical protein [Rhodopseudomonas rhenobacensis]